MFVGRAYALNGVASKMATLFSYFDPVATVGGSRSGEFLASYRLAERLKLIVGS